MKIYSLELDNVKRIRAVKIEPTSNGLTIIGGKNSQGKTSVLDGIAWALGGDKYRPSEPARDGSVIPPYIKIELDNGVIVERSGKNSTLKVTDTFGNRSGQQLLNDFISQFALDLPKFINASAKEKGDILLKIIGVGDKLVELERQENSLYNHRHTIGQIADQKAKFAKEMTDYPDAPSELVSAAELIKRQQEILAQNGENQRKRSNAANIKSQLENLKIKLNSVKSEYESLLAQNAKLEDDLRIANLGLDELTDISTAEIEADIENIEKINIKVRANLDKEKAQEEAKEYSNQYEKLTENIEAVRAKKKSLLDSAALPLPELSVENGELIYKGHKWDNMSSSEQLKVSTAIVRKLNPKCEFVLLDKLEMMDIDTLNDFGKWLEAEGLQAIATRVSTGGECSVIIEDGYIYEPTTKIPKAGEF